MMIISDRERADWLQRAEQAVTEGKQIAFGVYCDQLKANGRRCGVGGSCRSCSLLTRKRIDLHYGERMNPIYIPPGERKDILG